MRTITARHVHTYPPAEYDVFVRWLREQGLDPDGVWSVKFVAPFLCVRVYVFDADGAPQLKRGSKDEPRMRSRWLLRRSPVPDFVTSDVPF